MTDQNPNLPAAPWYGADAGDEIKGFVELKGWDGPKAAIESYQNLEKLLGADKAGRAIVWPKDEGDVKGWDALYAKLGRPEKADDYKLAAPKDLSDAFVKEIAPKMHELGLSTRQAQGLAEFVCAYEKQQAESWESGQKSAVEKAIADYKAELGQAFAPTVDLGKRAAKSLGITDEQFAGLEETLGLKGTVELFAAIGRKLGEDTFVGGEGSARVLSPAAAKARLEQLSADRTWTQRWMNGDAEAKREYEELNAAIANMPLAEYRRAIYGTAA